MSSTGEEAGENQQLLCPAELAWTQASLMEGAGQRPEATDPRGRLGQLGGEIGLPLAVLPQLNSAPAHLTLAPAGSLGSLPVTWLLCGSRTWADHS